jgi:hypothetical protein
MFSNGWKICRQIGALFFPIPTAFTGRPRQAAMLAGQVDNFSDRDYPAE